MLKERGIINAVQRMARLSHMVFLFSLLCLHPKNIEASMTKIPEAKSIPAAAAEIRPLLIGAAVPNLKLKTVQGGPFDLNQEIARKPAIIIFYRGGWCPYCNTQLGQLQTIETQLTQLGYQILALSPDRPEKLGESQEKNNLTYTLLSDSEMKAALAFGVAFRVDDGMVEKYKGFGIDLEGSSGEKHHLLPVPSVFIIGKDGLVKFTYVNPDYKVRVDSEVLLAAARSALE